MADHHRRPATAPRRAGWLAGVAGLALVLVGCGSMPDSGPAAPGRAVGYAMSEPLRVAPAGPRPGAGPAEIVGGFLHAGAASDDGQVVARSFLVGAAAGSWQADRGVVVYPEDASLDVDVRGTRSPVRVDVRTPVQGTVDAQGRYFDSPPGTTARASFTVVQSGGQWRVSQVDDSFGAWLPRYEFDRTFSAVPVAFVGAGGFALVPDLRWFTGPRRGLATSLVRQLLRGPPAHLGAAVVTGFPAGTTLAVDAVPTADGVARVDLSAQALTATPQMRRMMWAQLITTLRRLPEVAEVELTAAGASFDVPGVTSNSVYADTPYQDDVRVSGTPLVLTGDRLRAIDAVSGRLASESTRLLGSGRLSSLAIGAGGSLVVGTADARRRLLRLKPTEAVLATGTRLLDPVIDRSGVVWTADAARPGRLQVVPSEIAAAQPDRPQPTASQPPANPSPSTTPSAPLPLAAPSTAATPSAPPSPAASAASTTPARGQFITPSWLEGRVVRALDVSRDGARVAIVSSATDGSRRLDVTGVVRGPGGQPTGLAAPLEVARSLTGIIDVAWADSTALVVLGLGPRERAATAYEVVVGGTSTALPRVPGAALTVAAGDGLRALYVTTAAGTVLGRSGTGWATVGAGRSVSIPE